MGAACTITWGSRLTPRAEGEGGGGGPVWRGLGMMAGGQPSPLASVPTSEYTSSRTTFCDTLHRHQHQNQSRRHPRPVHDGLKRPLNSTFISGISKFWRSFEADSIKSQGCQILWAIGLIHFGRRLSELIFAHLSCLWSIG